MTTGTENKGKGIEEILAERMEMVNKGSCKDCLYCEGKRHNRYACSLLQCEGKGIELAGKDLQYEAYPMRCEVGTWSHTELCFAFMPQNCVVAPELQEHMGFMACLVAAAELCNKIKSVQSGVAQAQLGTLLAIMNENNYKAMMSFLWRGFEEIGDGIIVGK